MTDPASLGNTVASQVTTMQLRGPTALIHIGRPDTEEPHRSMKRVVKLRAENPHMRLFILVWTPEDRDAMKPFEDEKVKVILWETDEQISNFLMDFLMEIAGAAIIGPRHYVCAGNHITEGSYGMMIERCDTCQGAVTYVLYFKDRVERFAELFGTVIRLTNFDTRSGEYLQTVVSPTANILRNMEYIEGCRHEKPPEVSGMWKDKTALIVGAGPSLEDCVDDLARLSRKSDHRVICVGRAYKMLRDKGVTIDFTASCEMFDWDAAIFDGVSIQDAAPTILAFASMCAPETVKAWPGRKVPMLDIETAKLLNRTDWIYGGNSVAHHMLNFAFQVLDAKDAILVGIDLAYTKMKTHAEGANHEKWPDEIRKAEDEFQAEAWLPCTGKGNSFDPNCHRVPVVMGGGVAISNQILVRSSPSYECFGTLFSILIQKHGRKVWNGCANGQRIGGTEYLDLTAYKVEGE